MRLTEALSAIQAAPADAPAYPAILACGFTPLHLQTFLTAHLQQLLPQRRVQVSTGLYGDLAGTLESIRDPAIQAVAVTLEWADLDPRLGFRHAGTREPAASSDIVQHVQQSAARLQDALKRIPTSTQVALSLPSLPFPPVFTTPGGQTSEPELRVRETVLGFAACAARMENVSIASPVNAGPGFDLRSELLTGFPYTNAYADALGNALARVLAPPPPKKGLITDLDDTLWKGIVGEIGHAAVCWDLARHAQIHGLYQQVLSSLAGAGVLIGIASKNDPEVARRALGREDILLSSGKVFPIEVHWNSKSGSVERILKAWNIGADAVVFVDDSPMELAEVQAAHPQIECLLFPKSDYAAAHEFLRKLRDLFGKSRVSEEDRLRMDSIRRNAEFQGLVESGGAAPEEFLAHMDARIVLDFRTSGDPRVLELVNKTNQFNLNGTRYTEPDWRAYADETGAFVLSVSYEDKFGRLGKIAVLQGRTDASVVTVRAWVMSCRAFARRIEHQCLDILFQRFGADEIRFMAAPTPKNGPLREFLATVLGRPPEGTCTLARSQWEGARPALYHKVSEIDG